MEEAQSLSIDIKNIKKRVVSSFMSLTFGSLATSFFGLLTNNFILIRILSVETIGIFNISNGIISFFSFFSDIGLAASLIQKKEAVTSSDIKSTFTIQQTLVTILSLLIILSAPMLANFYHLNDDGVWLIRILGVCFFLSSLKVIPAVMLERELKFRSFVIVDIVETVIYVSLLIILAYANFGIWSFSLAALTQRIVGVILIYVIAPVRVGFQLDTQVIRKLLSFGVPFQLNSLLALLKDRLVPLIIAHIIGPIGVGYVTWAQSMAFLPLEGMNIIIRISFPLFSRLQSDKASLEKVIEKTLFLTALIVYPLLFGLGAVLPSVVTHILSSKVEAAIPSFYLFASSTFWAVISTTFTNVLNAIGHIKMTLKLMIFWTVLTWLLTPLLTINYGFTGVAISSFIISFTSIITIILVKRVLRIKVLESILLPTAVSLLMSIVVGVFSRFYVKDKLSLAVAVALGGVVYGGLIFILGKNKILREIQNFRNV